MTITCEDPPSHICPSKLLGMPDPQKQWRMVYDFCFKPQSVGVARAHAFWKRTHRGTILMHNVPEKSALPQISRHSLAKHRLKEGRKWQGVGNDWEEVLIATYATLPNSVMSSRNLTSSFLTCIPLLSFSYLVALVKIFRTVFWIAMVKVDIFGTGS